MYHSLPDSSTPDLLEACPTVWTSGIAFLGGKEVNGRRRKMGRGQRTNLRRLHDKHAWIAAENEVSGVRRRRRAEDDFDLPGFCAKPCGPRLLTPSACAAVLSDGYGGRLG